MHFFKNKQNINDKYPEGSYWISFSDMMTAMLMIFILICMSLIMRLSQIKEDIQVNIEDIKRATEVRSEILSDIKNKLKINNINVKIDINDTILHIPEGIFSFERGKWQIIDSMKSDVKLIGQALYDELIKIEEKTGKPRWEYLETVFIEGHSDSDPCNIKKEDLLLTNWELSALRAISLWEFWINETDYGQSMALLTGYQTQESKDNGEQKYLFSVSGYADTRPINTGSSSQDKAENRRIDIRFVVRQPSIKDIKDITTPMEEREHVKR